MIFLNLCSSGVLRGDEKKFWSWNWGIASGLILCMRYPVSEMNVSQEKSVARPGSWQASEDSIDFDALVEGI